MAVPILFVHVVGGNCSKSIVAFKTACDCFAMHFFTQSQHPAVLAIATVQYAAQLGAVAFVAVSTAEAMFKCALTLACITCACLERARAKKEGSLPARAVDGG